MLRVGVDVGGTFTDLVVYKPESGEIRTTKVPTTPSAPEEGVLNACSQAGIDMSDVDLFMHATTLVTNLVITRSGAKTGVIATRGFRDVLEIGLSHRRELYDLQWEKPRHFAPRHLIYEVSERIGSKGEVLLPPNRGEIERAVRELVAQGVEAIAVCLFNSYANGDHENVVQEVIREVAPNLYVSISSEVDPRVREYPRFSTTVLNSYAMPRVTGYVEKLGAALQADVKYMQSAGGVMSGSVAQVFPVRLIVSGPAAGVLGARFVAESLGIGNLITADVGGTSFDVCLIREGRPVEKDAVDVEWGIPARVHSIDVRSIGAGGGSIAWIDTAGTLRVGPQSAGAMPGPACYDQGGALPTVTDANLVVGLLSADNPLAGRRKLNLDLAWRALDPLSDALDMSPEEVASGILRLVNANMAQAIREVTVRRGIDPREFVLMAFGGAGGQHAIPVAEEVGIGSIVFPPNASTLSAFGLLTANLHGSAVKTIMVPLASLDFRLLGRQFQSLERRARDPLKGQEALLSGPIEVERILDVRYVGQSNEVPIRIASNLGVGSDELYNEFQDLHARLYGTRLDDPAEVVNIRTTVTGAVPRCTLPALPLRPRGSHREYMTTRSIGFFESTAAVIQRETLASGDRLQGPCVIEGQDTTILVPPTWDLEVDKFGTLIAKRSD